MPFTFVQGFRRRLCTKYFSDLFDQRRTFLEIFNTSRHISTVDDDNMSDISELSEDLTLPNSYNYDNYDNVNDNVNDNVIHRRGPRELNHLGPMQRSPRLRSGKRRE